MRSKITLEKSICQAENGFSPDESVKCRPIVRNGLGHPQKTPVVNKNILFLVKAGLPEAETAFFAVC